MKQILNDPKNGYPFLSNKKFFTLINKYLE